MTPLLCRDSSFFPFLCACVALAALFQGRSASGARDERITLSDHVVSRVQTTLDVLERDQDYPRARQSLESLFDQVVAWLDESESEAFYRVDFALRMVDQLEEVDEQLRRSLLPWLREHEDLASTLAFLIHDRLDEPKNVFQMLDILRQHRGDVLNDYASLVAAICVVHDQPFSRSVNENRATSIDPRQIFDYYAENEDRMYFGIRNVPAELLIYVVDTTNTLEELHWALDQYANNDNVGNLFFDIDYDYDHARKSTVKKSTAAGWGLKNIKQYGGVCADQAYFAMSVGKSIGVPTAYATAKAAELGHAWVGFLQADQRYVNWNFDNGRYESYQGIRGEVYDPQTRRTTADAYVALTAELQGSSTEDRQIAASYIDAAERLRRLRREPEPFDSELNGRPLRRPREADSKTQLKLIEASLRKCAGYTPAWQLVRTLASEGVLSYAQKRRWASLLDKMCGSRYPDFSLKILVGMIESIDNVRQQNQMWEQAFQNFQDRHDLAALVRVYQGHLWEKEEDFEKAGMCYMDVVDRYANKGPFVLMALDRAEHLLRDKGLDDRIPELYRQAWSNIDRPSGDYAIEFVRGGSWYKVGRRYAEALAAAGHTAESEKVMRRLATMR